jgi:Uma2 family endonuclease
MTLTPEKSASLTQRVLLHGISWPTYKRLLAELGDQRASRLAYDQGMLEITMPSDRQETHKKLLERMIETLTEELEIPAKSFGSTTLNRDDLERGAEPDSCYYIQHVNHIEGRHVALATDPPPDRIIEVDISSPSGRRLEIYKQLKVPEIWRYASGGVQIYQLREGACVPCDASLAFPLVSASVINQFLQQAETQDNTSFIRAWGRWIWQQVSPRVLLAHLRCHGLYASQRVYAGSVHPKSPSRVYVPASCLRFTCVVLPRTMPGTP